MGKTTTSAHLAHALALRGIRVAAVDLDPQGHLSACLGFARQNDHGVGDVVLDGVDARAFCVEARKNLQLLPAGTSLKRLEVDGSPRIGAAEFARQLRSIFAESQYVVMDCPPASGRIIDFALTAADSVLVPVAADYLALRGLSDLVATLRGYAAMHQDLLPQALVLTRFHVRRRLCHEVREKLLEYFPGQVLATPIRETVALAEAPSFGKTVFEYRRKDYGARDYKDLARDFVQGRFM